MTTLTGLSDAFREIWADEYDGEAKKRREEAARREKREKRELPGRAVVHRFMRKYQWHVAGTFAPCIRAWGEKHSEMCDALERLRMGKRR